MIGKNTIKLIKSLGDKKNRNIEKLFLVEGDKTVPEVLNSKFKVAKLFATSDFLKMNQHYIHNADQIIEVSKGEIEKASLMKTPQNCLALCSLPDLKQLPDKPEPGLMIFLDEIQDPGNLGTIIRICDWFGVKQLFCSPDTADVFNPKVIQASMGSFCRIDLWYSTFNPIYEIVAQSNFTVTGAFLDGKDIYKESLSQNSLLVLGNEGKGISKDITNLIQQKIKIPSYSDSAEKAESLNVAMAAAIICAEYKRQANYSNYSK